MRRAANKGIQPGTYRAICRDKNFLQSVANGRSAVFPSCECEIKNATADFYKDGQWVWSCSAIYAAANFDLQSIK